MTQVLVDSNDLLDVVTNDPAWFDWSSERLGEITEAGLAVFNPLILAEVSLAFETAEALDRAFPPERISRAALPWRSCFSAWEAFRRYRRAGGARTSPLADFFIGAHALVENMKLLTRDVRRFQTYFPAVELIVP